MNWCIHNQQIVYQLKSISLQQLFCLLCDLNSLSEKEIVCFDCSVQQPLVII